MKKFLAVILAAILAVGCFQGCSRNSSDSTASSSVNISGSSALQPLVKAAADKFRESNANTSITVNAGGSGTGLQNVFDKTVDIGASDIFAQEKFTADKANVLVDHIVCVVGVAAVVNQQTNIENVTKQQLIGIFTGKITNWKEIGGSDQKIVLINRPKSSGTRALFKAYALDGQEETEGHALTEDNSGTLKQNVAQTPGAIAYLAFPYLADKTVKVLSIDGVKASYENIYSGKYGIWGYEHLYTNGQPKGIVKSFLDYFSTSDCEQIIQEKGYGVSSKMTVKRSIPTASK